MLLPITIQPSARSLVPPRKVFVSRYPTVRVGPIRNICQRHDITAAPPSATACRDMAPFEPSMHVGGLAERKYRLDGHFQPTFGDAGQHMVDASLPFGRGVVDMAEMQAGGSLRSWRGTVSGVLLGAGPGPAPADHVAALPCPVLQAGQQWGGLGNHC